MPIQKATSEDLASRLEPKVTSLAKPTVEGLLQARADIQRNSSLKELFLQARSEERSAEWLADNLAPRLAGIWGQDFGEALEASRYLADEFFQLGDEGILLVSRETGKVLCRLTEDDWYQPGLVPRESGNFAQPLVRIRPELEGLLVSWSFEKGREERLEAIIRDRLNQTALLREEGDQRLLIASRKGRAQLSAAVGQEGATALLRRAGGTAGAFLGHFHIDGGKPPAEAVQVTLRATTRFHVGDPLTSNISHDRLGSLKGVAAQEWVRELGNYISKASRSSCEVESVDESELTTGLFDGWPTWVADPDALAIFKRIQPSLVVLPTPTAQPCGFKGQVGTLWFPEPVKVESRELFNRWETYAGVECFLVLDWSSVKALSISGIVPYTEVVVS